MKPMTLKEHEKFWAFIVLVIVIALLALLGTSLGVSAGKDEAINDAEQMALMARLRILDGAVVGLIGIAGMAAQALFRTGTPADEEMKSSVARVVQDAVPSTTPPKKVEIVQPDNKPVPVEEAHPQAEPPMFREGKP